MRRGQELENYVNGLLFDLEMLGIHGHKNNPLRTIKGYTLRGEPFDYEIFMPDKIHVFDAKECSAKNLRWPLGEFKDPSSRHYKQLSALLMCSQNEHVTAYFLVWFKQSNEFICFSPQQIYHAIFEGKGYMLPVYGSKWSLPSEVNIMKGK